MAVINFYPTVGKQSGTNFQALQQDGTAPADAAMTAATGWIMSNTAAGNSAQMFAQAERAANQFAADSTSLPTTPDNTNGNGFVTPTPLRGIFPAGNWTLQMVSRSVTAVWTNGVVAYKWRVYRAALQTGAGAAEITSTPVVSANSPAFALVNTNYTTALTWGAPAFEVNDEFLIFTLAVKIVTAASGTGTTRDVNLRVNPSSIITTTNLAPFPSPVNYSPPIVEPI